MNLAHTNRTPFSALPRDCLALIYESLDSRGDRKSFLSCCKDVRTCPQVCVLSWVQVVAQSMDAKAVRIHTHCALKEHRGMLPECCF